MKSIVRCKGNGNLAAINWSPQEGSTSLTKRKESFLFTCFDLNASLNEENIAWWMGADILDSNTARGWTLCFLQGRAMVRFVFRVHPMCGVCWRWMANLFSFFAFPIGRGRGVMHDVYECVSSNGGWIDEWKQRTKPSLSLSLMMRENRVETDIKEQEAYRVLFFFVLSSFSHNRLFSYLFIVVSLFPYIFSSSFHPCFSRFASLSNITSSPRKMTYTNPRQSAFTLSCARCRPSIRPVS